MTYLEARDGGGEREGRVVLLVAALVVEKVDLAPAPRRLDA